MKNVCSKINVMAILLFALLIVGTACTNDETALPEVEESGITSFTAVLPGNDATTRLALDGSAKDDATNPKLRVTWETGETVKLFPTGGMGGTMLTYTIASGAETKEASFSGSALQMMATYNIYGPGDLISTTDWATLSFDYRGQTQIANNNITHLRDYTFYGGGSISGAMPPSQTTSIPSTKVFTHMGALMQVKLTIPEDITGLTAFTIASTSNIWCAAAASGMGNVYESDFTLNLDGFDATAADGLTLWMMLPANANDINIPAGTLTLSLTNGTKTFTKDVTITGDKTFAAGGWYVLEAELEKPLNGDGLSAATPYEIHTLADLRFMRDKVNEAEGNYLGAYYKLMDDITVGDESWMDGSQGIFNGNFDGNDKTISGITKPLFEGGFMGTLQNLHFSGDINVDNLSIGGITSDNNGAISGCSVQGTLTQAGDFQPEAYIGGIAGENSGIITGCWVNITQFATADLVMIPENVGYIVGENSGTVSGNAWVEVTTGFVPNVDHPAGFGTGYLTYQDLVDGFLTTP